MFGSPVPRRSGMRSFGGRSRQTSRQSVADRSINGDGACMRGAVVGGGLGVAEGGRGVAAADDAVDPYHREGLEADVLQLRDLAVN